VRGFSEGEMTWRRKRSEGGGSGSALMTDGERKRKGGQSRMVPRGGTKMGGLVRRALELEGAGDTSTGTMVPGSKRAR
jgi:hypothetical protein